MGGGCRERPRGSCVALGRQGKEPLRAGTGIGEKLEHVQPEMSQLLSVPVVTRDSRQ